MKFCAMWKKVAKEFGKDPAVIGFDLLVEPHAPKKAEDDKYADFKYRTSNRWRDVAKQAIKAIRDENITTPILVEPDLWAARCISTKPTLSGPRASRSRGACRRVTAWCAPSTSTIPATIANRGRYRSMSIFRALKEAFTAICTWRSRNSAVPVCVNEFGAKQCLPYAELFLRKELQLLKEQNINHAVWLWQANDPGTNHDFDVRYNRKILAELTANWKHNTDAQGGRQEPARRTGKWLRDPHSGRLARGSSPTSVLEDSSGECCPCDSVFYDPALKLQVPVKDARAEFRRLSVRPAPDNRAYRRLASSSARRGSRSVKQGTAQPVADDNHSRAIGYWPKVDQCSSSRTRPRAGM